MYSGAAVFKWTAGLQGENVQDNGTWDGSCSAAGVCSQANQTREGGWFPNNLGYHPWTGRPSPLAPALSIYQRGLPFLNMPWFTVYGPLDSHDNLEGQVKWHNLTSCHCTEMNTEVQKGYARKGIRHMPDLEFRFSKYCSSCTKASW